MYNSIVHDHLCDKRLPTFETLSFFAYWLYGCIRSGTCPQGVEAIRVAPTYC